MNEALRVAIAWASKGALVLPINGEKRAIRSGESRWGATNDLDKLPELFRSADGCAVIPGSLNCVVVDIDDKCKWRKGTLEELRTESTCIKTVGRHGKHGSDEWELFKADNPDVVDHTATTRTASGGRHLWYELPEGVTVGNQTPFKAIDIRGHDGYVVAPGTVIGSKEWKEEVPWESRQDIPASLLGGLTKSGVGRRREATEQDIDDAGREMYERLRELGFWGPQVREDGEKKTIMLAAPHRDKWHESVSVGWEYNLAHFFTTDADAGNGKTFQGNYNIDELNYFIETGYKQPIALVVGPDLVKTSAEKRSLRDRLFTPEQLLALPPPKWLVRDLLQKDSITFLTADPNVGKTFLAIDWAYHIATGAAWMGRDVEQGTVLYIAAEGGGRPFGDRCLAWKEHHDVVGVVGFNVINEAVDLGTKDEISELIELVKELKPDLIVIDTYTMSTPTADTDSGGKDAKIVLHNLATLKAASSACILAIDHPGKSSLSKDTIRGSVAQQGRVDVHMYLDGKAGEDKFSLVCKKTRGTRHFQPVSLALATIELSNGGTSCVITESDFLDDVLEHGPRLSPSEQVAFDALKDLSNITGGVSNKAWLEECGKKKPQWVNNPTSFTKTRDGLIEKGLVWKRGERSSARYGIKEG